MGTLNFEDKQKLDDLYDQLLKQKQTYIGYPNSQLLNNETLSKFLNLTINNVGDPFIGNNGMNTFTLEKEVLTFMSELLHLPQDKMWGYVTNGGTEGNIYGLYLGRESYPNGIVYFSSEAHYSIPKAVRLLGLRSANIQAQPNGEINYDHFEETVKTLRHYPVIVSANIGTTMKGAIDNVEKIVSILNKLKINKYYIHCDSALFGTMLPFLEGSPLSDFRLPISSLAISGHKFLGSPIPCGIVLTRQEVLKQISTHIEYIGSSDSTISGSRDGFSVLVLWHAIKRFGKEGLSQLVQRCMETTNYALNKLKELDWPAWANPFSNIIVISRPSAEMIKKWQLATEGEISHLIVMPGITNETINEFIYDLQQSLNERRKHG